MTYPKVSIIILNWNGLKDTIECLESLKKITYPNYEVIIVDNNSKGNDADVLAEKYKDYINVIRNKENFGFAGGNNIAIREVLREEKKDYILLLNNDTVVKENFLNELVKYCKNITVIAAPLISNYYYPNQIWSSGGKFNIFTGAYDNSTDSIKNNPVETKFISGCCWLVNKDVFKKISLLDERYFLYSEDADFCCSLRRKGYKLKIIPSSIIFHKVGSSTGKKSPLMFYHFHRSRLRFISKNYKGFKRLFYLNLNLFTRWLRSIQYFLQGERELSKSIVKAIRDYKISDK